MLDIKIYLNYFGLIGTCIVHKFKALAFFGNTIGIERD